MTPKNLMENTMTTEDNVKELVVKMGEIILANTSNPDYIQRAVNGLASDLFETGKFTIEEANEMSYGVFTMALNASLKIAEGE